MFQNMLLVLMPFIAGGVVWLLEKARIRVEKRKIEEILRILYEIIFEAEDLGFTGEDKRILAVAMAENSLSDEQKKIIKKYSGNIAEAVQFVFERYGQPVIERKKIVRLLEKISRSSRERRL